MYTTLYNLQSTFVNIISFIFFLIKKIVMFIFEGEREERETERQRDRAQAGEEQREGETQIPKQAPGSELSVQSSMWDSKARTVNREIMT